MKASWDGFTYNLDDPDFVWSINNGRTEPYTRELAIVKSYLKHFPSCNHTYIDVGGHIGTTSFAYSRLFENVLAFEPNKKSYDFFVQNIELNGVKNVKVVNKGAFNKTTSVSVVHHGPNSGCYYIKETEKSPSSIDTVRLDDLEFDSPVDFIKVDTEGSELFVLEGAKNMIAKYKPLIQIETNECSDRFYGYNKDRIFEFLASMGYKVLDDDNSGNPFFFCK
jgi:FkbM family methyltransferase